MIRTPVLTAAIAVLGAIAIGTAFAQGPRGSGQGPGRGGGFGEGRGPRAGLMLRGLDLSDAQRDQVRAIRERYQEQTQAAARQLAEARGAQRDAIWGLLTPEQQAEVTARRGQREEVRGERRERLGERRPQRQPGEPL